jgi:hypothetical protein
MLDFGLAFSLAIQGLDGRIAALAAFVATAAFTPVTAIAVTRAALTGFAAVGTSVAVHGCCCILRFRVGVAIDGTFFGTGATVVTATPSATRAAFTWLTGFALSADAVRTHRSRCFTVLVALSAAFATAATSAALAARCTFLAGCFTVHRHVVRIELGCHRLAVLVKALALRAALAVATTTTAATAFTAATFATAF